MLLNFFKKHLRIIKMEIQVGFTGVSKITMDKDQKIIAIATEIGFIHVYLNFLAEIVFFFLSNCTRFFAPSGFIIESFFIFVLYFMGSSCPPWQKILPGTFIYLMIYSLIKEIVKYRMSLFLFPQHSRGTNYTNYFPVFH